MTDIVFISDWAGGPSLYPVLSKHGDFLVPFLNGSELDINRRLDAGATTLIGWSLGAHMILRRWTRVVENFERIVLVSPFTAMTDYVPESFIRDLQSLIKTSPDNAVREYHRQCGIETVYSNLGIEDADGLTAGLNFLLESRAMPSHRGSEKTWIIQGEYDRVIPPLAAEDIWEIMPKATHMALPCGHWIPENELLDLIG